MASYNQKFVTKIIRRPWETAKSKPANVAKISDFMMNVIWIGFKSDSNRISITFISNARARYINIYIKDKDIDKDIDLHYDVVHSLLNVHIPT